MTPRGVELTDSWANAIQYAFSMNVARRNGLIALIVGSLLTLTNQFDVILSGSLTLWLGVKILINFLTPFVVSSTSAVLNRQSCAPHSHLNDGDGVGRRP